MITGYITSNPNTPYFDLCEKPGGPMNSNVMTLMLKRILIIILLSLPLAAWAFFKPVRILAPELIGVTCVSAVICLDDSSRVAEASALYQNALQFVGSSIGEIEEPPRVVFCASEACNESFGFKSAANTIGTFGIVISPRAWKPYYLRHEMIHHLQKERLGNFKGWLVTPDWFMEGMAYLLSEDPRPILPEPLQQYRSEFATWYKQVGRERLWLEADKL